jgi:hypothetical protein
MTEESGRFEKILVLEGEVEAQLLEGVLNDHGIEHIVRPYHDSVYDGLFEASRGWGHIEAHPDRKKEILELYRAIQGENG